MGGTLNEVTMLSIVFAAPMVFFIPADLDQSDSDVVEELRTQFRESSVNYVFDQDVVPRLPGYPEFYKPALQRAAQTGVAQITPGPVVASALGLLARRGAEMFLDSGSMNASFDELGRGYQHFSTIIFHE